MDIGQLADKILRVIGLLVGLNILQIIITYTIPYFMPLDNPDLLATLTTYGYWIGNIIYKDKLRDTCNNTLQTNWCLCFSTLYCI